MSHSPGAAPVTPVAIVGAGPVGLLLALALARHGVRSTLLERKQATSASTTTAGRSVMVPMAARTGTVIGAR